MINDLPAGWKQADLLDGKVVLSNPQGGHVTIDYTRRSFALGYGSTTPLRQKELYRGRLWRERLEADAIAALNEIYKEK